MSKLTYTLPAFKDDDDDQVTLTAFKTLGGAPLPSFIQTTTPTAIIITPTSYSEVGSLSVTLRLTDAIDTADFEFLVVVTNQAPTLDAG
jgi:hypothetical protein